LTPSYVTNQNVQLNEIHMHAYYEAVFDTNGIPGSRGTLIFRREADSRKSGIPSGTLIFHLENK
jgi:hypothetical protein